MGLEFQDLVSNFEFHGSPISLSSIYFEKACVSLCLYCLIQLSVCGWEHAFFCFTIISFSRASFQLLSITDLLCSCIPFSLLLLEMFDLLIDFFWILVIIVSFWKVLKVFLRLTLAFFIEYFHPFVTITLTFLMVTFKVFNCCLY
jgi:hypothetical protein